MPLIKLSKFWEIFLLFLSSVIIINHAKADQESLYEFEWLDKDKKIYVLQNRLYNKVGRFHLSLLGGLDTSAKFTDTYFGAFKGGYFISESWGIEFGHSVGTGETNTTAKAIVEQAATPFYRQIKSITHANVMWSPFYGKFNTFDQIYYLDWFIGLGVASITDENNKNDFPTSGDRSLTTETHTGALWNTGFLFYLSNAWSVRFEFQGVHYKALRYRETTAQGEFSSNVYQHHYSVNLGLTWHI
jgi:outer membrane beta-barrel protein